MPITSTRFNAGLQASRFWPAALAPVMWHSQTFYPRTGGSVVTGEREGAHPFGLAGSVFPALFSPYLAQVTSLCLQPGADALAGASKRSCRVPQTSAL